MTQYDSMRSALIKLNHFFLRLDLKLVRYYIQPLGKFCHKRPYSISKENHEGIWQQYSAVKVS